MRGKSAVLAWCLFWVALGLGFSCSAEEPTPESTTALYEQAAFESITLERTGCFGFCPTYEVTIHADGLVEYRGHEHVDVVGEEISRVAPELLPALLTALAALDYFALEPKYEYKVDDEGNRMTITDQPWRITTLRAGGREHRVENYFGGPDALRDLEDQIDQLADTKRWTGRD